MMKVQFGSPDDASRKKFASVRTFCAVIALPLMYDRGGTHARHACRSRLGGINATYDERRINQLRRCNARNGGNRRAIDDGVRSRPCGCVYRFVPAVQAASVWIFSTARRRWTTG